MKVKGLCKSVADVDLSGREFDSLSLKIEVANATKQNSDDIFLAVKYGRSWRKMKSGMEIGGSDVQIAYLVVHRRIESEWEFVWNVGRKGLRVEKRSGAGSNAVTQHCRDIDDVLQRFDVEEQWRNFLVPVVEVLQVWSGDDGGFRLQYDAETDLRHFVTENRASDIRVRYCINKLVEWFKIVWQRKLGLLSAYADDFVIDADGNVKLIPDWRWPFTEDDPVPESIWVRRCGLNLAVAFSEIDDREEVWGKIFSGDVESVLTGIKEDVAGIIRSCVAPEEDRATFSYLLDFLSLNCVTKMSNFIDQEDVIEDTVAYSWRGLRRGSVVEIIKRKHDTAPDDIFIFKSDKIVGDIITVDYQPEMTLSYIIIESIAPLEEKTEIGEGAFGTVYSCKDRQSNEFAIKEFSKILRKKEFFLSFIREVDVLKRLKHERIVEYFGYFHQSRQSIFIKMELMETSLGAIVQERGAIVRDSGSGLQVGEVRHYTLHIAEGLAYLHSRSIIHRDLKCDNVLVKGGNAKLTDFGLSKVLTMSKMNIAQPQSSVGTVYAMAPEIIASEPYDCSVDIWSLGAAVWEMASGRYCFKGLNEVQIILKIDKTKALEHNPNIPREIQTFIDLCARSNPNERPTVTQLLTDPFLQTP